jgi:hypothetical protein
MHPYISTLSLSPPSRTTCTWPGLFDQGQDSYWLKWRLRGTYKTWPALRALPLVVDVITSPTTAVQSLNPPIGTRGHAIDDMEEGGLWMSTIKHRASSIEYRASSSGTQARRLQKRQAVRLPSNVRRSNVRRSSSLHQPENASTAARNCASIPQPPGWLAVSCPAAPLHPFTGTCIGMWM